MKISGSIFHTVFAFLAVSVFLTVSAMESRAQVATDPSVDSGVTVDLSVLEGNGYNPGPVNTFPRGEPRKLLIPNTTFPKSALHVPVPGKRPAAKHVDAKKKPTKKRKPARRVKTAKREAPSLPPKPKPTPPAAKPQAKKAAAPVEPPLKKMPPAEPPVQQIVKKKPPAAKPVAPAMPPEKKTVKPMAAKIPPSIPPSATPKAAQAVKETKTPDRVKIPPKTVKKVQKAPPPPASKAGSGSGPALRIAFKARDTKLPSSAKKTLKSLANKIRDARNLRLQIRAFAGGESLSSSRARRVSLSRALSVRSYLIENGIRSTRIDVRALGDKTIEDPINRVDVTIVER